MSNQLRGCVAGSLDALCGLFLPYDAGNDFDEYSDYLFPRAQLCTVELAVDLNEIIFDPALEDKTSWFEYVADSEACTGEWRECAPCHTPQLAEAEQPRCAATLRAPTCWLRATYAAPSP